MASEGFYNANTGEGYNEFIANKKAAQEKTELYLESEEFKSKIQEKLNKLEEYLTKNSYTKLGPDSKLEKGKVYYILERGDRESENIQPIKVTCIAVNPDGSGNFEGFAESFAVSPRRYNNISIVGDNVKYFGVWRRPPSLNTEYGVGSATKYKAGKKSIKSRKSRKSRKSKRKARKARKTRRH
jgi:hypothetical protein